MPIDYRLDPFQDVLNPVTITGETHTIPSVSPFTIRLDEVPLKETPSSISLTIGGVVAEEVSSAPAPGQFWPDYSTGADGDDDWNTGTILFNVADAGKVVVVTYKGTGVLVASETLKTHVFTSSGTITAPTWATHAIISGCAGGGGGSNNYESSGPGSAGGATSFGNLLTLGGGGGAPGFLTYTTAPNGSGYSGLLEAENRIRNGLISAGSYIGGRGGGGPFGSGGDRRTTTGAGNNGTGYGAGGGGGMHSLDTGGGGGGAGGACVNRLVAVTGGATYTITIGAGGNGGGAAARKGGNGTPGFLIIRWIRM